MEPYEATLQRDLAEQRRINDEQRDKIRDLNRLNESLVAVTASYRNQCQQKELLVRALQQAVDALESEAKLLRVYVVDITK